MISWALEAHTWNSSYLGRQEREIAGKQFARPHLQNNQSKMDWRHGPCGRTPALPARSPEFKPQFYQKKKKT
jgi:hypothetical protein